MEQKTNVVVLPVPHYGTWIWFRGIWQQAFATALATAPDSGMLAVRLGLIVVTSNSEDINSFFVEPIYQTIFLRYPF